MATKVVKCPSCNVENSGSENFCRDCGTNLTNPFQNPGGQQLQQPFIQKTAQLPGADTKLAAGLCGILLGAFGIHKFILGYQNEGIIMLVVSLVGGFALCGIPTIIVGVIGLIEGILYLLKSDEDFVRTYVDNKKGWF